jgi:hypothetical protein
MFFKHHHKQLQNHVVIFNFSQPTSITFESIRKYDDNIRVDVVVLEIEPLVFPFFVLAPNSNTRAASFRRLSQKQGYDIEALSM